MRSTGMNAKDITAISADPDALEVFYRAHLEAVQGFIARRTGDPHTAADLTAEVFLAAIEAASSYRPGLGTPRGWLFGIDRHVLAEHYRSEDIETRARGRSGGRRSLDPDSFARIEERIDAEHAARLVYAALATLSEPERAVIELVALDGLGPSDAARVLGISTGAARVRLHRTRRKIRDLTSRSPIHHALEALS